MALNGALGLDLDKEKKLVEGGLYELKEHEATKEAISLTMKKLGMKRYVIITIAILKVATSILNILISVINFIM